MLRLPRLSCQANASQLRIAPHDECILINSVGALQSDGIQVLHPSGGALVFGDD